jgi:hypothetical protein
MDAMMPIVHPPTGEVSEPQTVTMSFSLTGLAVCHDGATALELMNGDGPVSVTALVEHKVTIERPTLALLRRLKLSELRTADLRLLADSLGVDLGRARTKARISDALRASRTKPR